jgi:hypothetical protein
MPVWGHKTFKDPGATKKTSTRISVRIIRVNGKRMSLIKILEEYHNTLTARHAGMAKTI